MFKDIFKNKITVGVLSVIIIGSLVNLWFFNAVSKDLKAALAEAESIRTEAGVAAAIASMEQLKQQEIEINDKFNDLSELFPKELTPEAALHILKIQSDAAKININNITFDMVEPIDTFNATSLSVKFAFKGNYISIRDFIDRITNNAPKIAIRQMNFSGFGTNLTGNAVVSFYGYKNSAKEYLLPSYSETSGKYDLFRIFKGGEAFVPAGERTSDYSDAQTSETTAANTGKRYDFYMVMNKYTDDASNIIVGKGKDSEITSDGNKVNWVNIYFAQDNGNLYYRYRTEDGVYPKDTVTQEFTPLNSDVITVNIASNVIVSVNDKSRMQLNVYNDSNKKVQITVTGKDGKKRVIKNVMRGNVEVLYE